MDLNNPNHGLETLTVGQPGDHSAQMSLAELHLAEPFTLHEAQSTRPFHYIDRALPQNHPQGLVHQPITAPASRGYPASGHALSPAVQIPSSPPTSSALASGPPASPVQFTILSSDQSYPQWDAQMLPGAMGLTSTISDEREGYQRVIQGSAPTPAATGCDMGALRQQRHHSIGNSPYSLYLPPHQQLHRRVSSHPYAAVETSAFAPYDTPSQIHQDLHYQAYVQPRAFHPPQESHQWSPHTSLTPMTFQVGLHAMQQIRSITGQFSHSMSSPAVPSPIQAIPSPSTTYRVTDMEGLTTREKGDSIVLLRTASSSSAESGMVNPAARMVLMYPQPSSSSVPSNYDLPSPVKDHMAELPVLHVPATPNYGLASEDVVNEVDPSVQAALLTTRGRRRKDSRPHKCPTCAKGFSRPSALETHMTVHSGAKPYQCPIKTCNKSYTVRSSARRHLKTHGIEIKASERRGTVNTDASTSRSAMPGPHGVVADADGSGAGFPWGGWS